MATTVISVRKISEPNSGPLASSVPESLQVITPSGSNQVTTDDVNTDLDSQVWEVSTDVNVKLAFDTSPNATSVVHAVVLAGQTRHFLAVAGHKASVVLL